MDEDLNQNILCPSGSNWQVHDEMITDELNPPTGCSCPDGTYLNIHENRSTKMWRCLNNPVTDPIVDVTQETVIEPDVTQETAPIVDVTEEPSIEPSVDVTQETVVDVTQETVVDVTQETVVDTLVDEITDTVVDTVVDTEGEGITDTVLETEEEVYLEWCKKKQSGCKEHLPDFKIKQSEYYESIGYTGQQSFYISQSSIKKILDNITKEHCIGDGTTNAINFKLKCSEPEEKYFVNSNGEAIQCSETGENSEDINKQCPEVIQQEIIENEEDYFAEACTIPHPQCDISGTASYNRTVAENYLPDDINERRDYLKNFFVNTLSEQKCFSNMEDISSYMERAGGSVSIDPLVQGLYSPCEQPKEGFYVDGINGKVLPCPTNKNAKINDFDEYCKLWDAGKNEGISMIAKVIIFIIILALLVFIFWFFDIGGSSEPPSVKTSTQVSSKVPLSGPKIAEPPVPSIPSQPQL